MSILSVVSQFLTPQMIERIAGMLGAQQSSVQSALKGAVPGVLSAILSAAGTKQGSEAFSAALARQKPGALDALGGMFGKDGRGTADSGADMLSSIIGGGRMGVFASQLKDYAGLPEGSSGALLGAVGSIAMAALGNTAKDRGLDAAGVLRELQGEKDEIARALPGDFASSLRDAGLLDSIPGIPGAAAAAAPKVAPVPPRPVPPRATVSEPRTTVTEPPRQSGGGWWRWVVGLVVLALLGWLLASMFGSEPEAPVTEAPPATDTPETTEAPPAADAPETTAAPPAADAPETTEAPAATEPPATAAAPEPAEPADPLVVGGTDLGATVRGSFDRLSSTLGGITDTASAEAALPALTSVRDDLAGMETTVAGLPPEGKSALQSLITGALPTLRETNDKLLGDSAISGVIKPVLDDILNRLTAYSQA